MRVKNPVPHGSMTSETTIRANQQQSTERITFLQRVQKYVGRPMWTPAEGCLLINGVIPPESCVVIPSVGHQLEDPTTGASEKQLASAKQLLQEYHWRLNWSRRQFRDWKTRSTGDLVSPSDFLRWCSDIGQGSLRPMPFFPEFIRHIHRCGEGKNPFRQTVEEEIATLEDAFVGGLVRSSPVAQSTLPESNAQQEPVRSEPCQDAALESSQSVSAGETMRARRPPGPRRRKQYQALETAVLVHGYPPKEIPKGGKQEIKRWCQENHPKLFSQSDSTFDDIWQDALDAGQVRMADHELHSNRQ